METEQNMKEKKSSKRKYLIAAVCVVLFAIVALVVASLNQEQKPDPESERVIRQFAARRLYEETGLKKEPNDLVNEDFTKINEISIIPNIGSYNSFYWTAGSKLKFGELSDITLLEKFINLQELNCNILYPDKKIPKCMKLLGKVGIFDIKERFAIDLNPIKNLTALKSLRLSNSQISDITPLKNLVNLETLFIDFTNVSDLEPLRGLKNLRVLSIMETKVSSLEPIMHLEKLERLIVINCPNITDQQLKELRAAHPNIVIIKDYVG